ncbi:MAG: DsbA family protein, partial [Methylocystis sp.]|nr:DsbA family protein [Methylocystis sp.]
MRCRAKENAMSFFISLAAGACLALGAATPLFAEELSGKQKVEIEKVVHDYLLSNPEVVREAIDELGKREKVA